MKIDIKPLSVNEAWQGRRFKTKKYKKYELDVLKLLRPTQIHEGSLIIELTFGMSSNACDWDNPIKPFVDILQKKYNFNDNRIKKATVEVIKTKKGEEFIEFDITALEPTI